MRVDNLRTWDFDSKKLKNMNMKYWEVIQAAVEGRFTAERSPHESFSMKEDWVFHFLPDETHKEDIASDV